MCSRFELHGAAVHTAPFVGQTGLVREGLEYTKPDIMLANPLIMHQAHLIPVLRKKALRVK